MQKDFRRYPNSYAQYPEVLETGMSDREAAMATEVENMGSNLMVIDCHFEEMDYSRHLGIVVLRFLLDN